MSAADLAALRAEFAAAGWIIEFHETSAGDYWSAVMPGRQVKASTPKRLRERIAPADEDYTARAVSAVAEAVADGADVGGWLAAVLAAVAARLGSSAALVAGRPGGWEADLVLRLVRGLVGHADEALLPDPLPPEADRPGPAAPMVGGVRCGNRHGHATQAGADLCDTNPDA